VTFTPNGKETYAQAHTTIVNVTDSRTLTTLRYQRTNSPIEPSEPSFTSNSTFTTGQSFTLSGETGSRYLRILAKDSAGNTTITGSKAFNFDTTAPVVTITPKGNLDPKKSHATTVNVIDPGDAKLNTDTLKYLRSQQSTPMTKDDFASAYRFTNDQEIIKADGDGNRYLRILAEDNAKNMTITRSDAFYFDNTIPIATSVTYTPKPSSGHFTNEAVTVQITLNEVVLLPNGRIGSTTGTLFTRTFENNITKTTVPFTDLAGNQGSTEIEITWIDTNKPSATNLRYSPSDGNRTSGSVTITLKTNKPIINLGDRINI
jgi:hypothetical protein